MRPYLFLTPVALALCAFLAEPAVVEAAGQPELSTKACEPVSQVSDATSLGVMVPRPFADAITDDLHATAPITLEPKDFPPASSGGAASLRVRGSVVGVTRVSEKIEIAAGTSFRMRFSVIMGHPPGFRVNAVTVEAACSNPCAANERRCPMDGACYAEGKEFCRECDKSAPDRCACLGPAARALPEGTACTFMPPASMPVHGTCQAGTCRQR